jgi:tRNA A-37 threonylcarbamoyl transferase component Bud32
MSNIFIKENVSENEYFIHEWVYYLIKNNSNSKENHINIKVPKIYNYDSENKRLSMQMIYGDNLSNIYGEDIENVPKKLINIIQKTINLMNSYLVEYPDITGYNFMLDKGEHLWIIDFEHAKCRDIQEPTDNFVLKFINGTNEWNPEFK